MYLFLIFGDGQTRVKPSCEIKHQSKCLFEPVALYRQAFLGRTTSLQQRVESLPELQYRIPRLTRGGVVRSASLTVTVTASRSKPCSLPTILCIVRIISYHATVTVTRHPSTYDKQQLRASHHLKTSFCEA